MGIVHRITTDETLIADLRAALNERGVSVGNGTLADIFGACQALGIHPDDRVDVIEFGVLRLGISRICAERNEHGHWEVRERE